jgi:hypothetical protein
MSIFSREAADRSKLFESFAQRHGFTLLRGRFGGEYNNDQLSIRGEKGSTQLLLGLKVSDESGNVQLDPSSMGPYQQFSKNWLLTVSYALKLDPTQSLHGEAIEKALTDRTLSLFVLALIKPSREAVLVSIALPD